MAVDSPADFTFLDAVNRILRTVTLIRGDDDNITTFSDTQHAANLELAKISIQDELMEVAHGPDHLLDLEFAEGTITTSNGQRVYTLPSDFRRFAEKPYFYRNNTNYLMPQFPGGRDNLKISVSNYKTNSGEPAWWYWEPATNKSIGLYSVPDNSYTYTYDYEKSVMVELATDELPFQTKEENYTFCTMASRRFSFMFERADNIQTRLEADAMYNNAKARLKRLMRPTNPPRAYGRAYI